MAIIDTTNVIESSMFLKAKLKKNMVGDNYYLESLQSKIDAEWDYRYNVFDIEEEPIKQTAYTKHKPNYVPIEVVMQHVITDKGEKLAEDWQKLVFRDIKHPTAIGKRYRFSLDFEKNPTYTEEEKEKESSIWISVNQDATIATAGIVIRKCNSNLVFGGSPNMDKSNITEFHIEPCILDTDFKYINIYTNSVVNINQAEIYATMQYNYFTKNIKPNDRFVVGPVDKENKDNNTVFKVKAISKFVGDKTFNNEQDGSLDNIPLILVAMDRDVISETDDFENRISNQPALYKVVQEGTEIKPSEPVVEPKKDFQIVIDNEETIILLGEEGRYKCELFCNNVKEEVDFNYEATLFGGEKDNKYFEITQNKNVFTILNKRACLTNKLKIVFSCQLQDGSICSKELLISLGGNY